MSDKALIISEDTHIISKISTVFEFIDYEVNGASSLETTNLRLDEHNDYLIVLISVKNEANRNEIVALINRRFPALPVYLLKLDDTKSNPQTPEKGVTGSIRFPIQYKDLLSRIRLAELERKTSRDSKALSTTLTGNSPQIKNIEGLIRHVSMTDANVLLLGESGTGKEVVARGIHQLSLRTDRPFVAVNCGAIPAELLESELFGHEKGSFTGAINTRRGRFELAEGGTLFLDEIGDMPMPMQVKLLRVLQERTFERIGGTKTLTSNVRLISATHQDLEKRIGEGKFRMDLFYRLNVFPIELPAVRDRPGDIPLLIEKFSIRMELDHRSPIEFDDSAIKALSKHPLLGNVRELENLVERLAILYPGETITEKKLPQRYQLQLDNQSESVVSLQLNDNNQLPPSPTVTEDGIDLKHYLTSLEKSLILQALENTDWVVTKAAKSLALQRTTLIEKIRKLGIVNKKQDNAEDISLPL